MCGIAAVVRISRPEAGEARERALARPHEQAIPERWLNALDASIRHRGPDGQGRFRDRAVRSDGAIVDVALVHRRLSIIDHAGGGQPMVSLRGPGRPDGAGRRESGVPGAAFEAERALVPPPLLFRGEPGAAVDYRPVPVRAEDDLLAVVFNGCIYNHRALRAELQSEAGANGGHTFETDHSDTEVLLHGWRALGVRIFDDLDGMFAACLWDRRRAALCTARDRFGEKPVYARLGTVGGDTVASVCSALPGVMRLPQDRREPAGAATRDRVQDFALTEWIRFGWSPMLPIADVYACTPGTATGSGDWHGNGLGRVERAFAKPDSWGHSFRDLTKSRSKALPEETLDGLLSAAVRSRLEADVPVGVFLSGGIDSSLIATYAGAHRRDVEAFTVRMPDARYDESAAAAAVAKAVGIRHHVLECRPSPAEDLVTLIGQLGLPFGDSSLLPTHWVARAARAHVPVALTGDGGDELFAGYERYRAARYLAYLGITRHALRLLPDPLRGLGPDPTAPAARRARFLSAAAHQGMRDILSIFPTPMLRALGRDPSVPAIPGAVGSVVTAMASAAGLMSEVLAPVNELLDREATAGAIRADLLGYLPEDILRKSDTASMGVALEARAPMLARGVSDAALRARIGVLMPGGERKGLLRRVARRYLPAEIVDRPKRGFAIPIGEWFRSDYGGLGTLLRDRMSAREPFGPPGLGIDLDMRFVRTMLEEHLGTGPSGLVRRDHGQRLYQLLVLSVWADGQGEGAHL